MLCCEFNNWSKNLNEEIKQKLLPRIEYIKTEANRRPTIPWLKSSFWFSFSQIALNLLPQNTYLLSLQSSKRSWLLLRKLEKIKSKFDLVVAHNPGSFYPALLLAKKQNISFGIDLEDYHPGELIDKKKSKDLKTLLKKILPKAAYLSAASPSILEKTIEDIDSVKNKISVILNVFAVEEFMQPVKDNSDKLKAVWFSQNIGENRGLEEVVPAIFKNDNIELHLYGNCKTDFYEKWLKGKKNIFIHKPMLQGELHKELKFYDLALALEKPGINAFRELCLTNKLLAYFQAGLYIIATDTIAQKKFINDHPEHGIISKLNENALFTSIQEVYLHKALIRGAAGHRFERARIYTWENESKKLLQIWKEAVR